MSGLTVKSSFGRLDKDSEKVKPDFVTGSKIGSKKLALDVIPFGFYELSTSNTAAAGSNEYTIVKTAHGAKEGDLILLTSGSQDERIVFVESVIDADIFKTSHICSASLLGASFNIYRQTFQRFSSTGEALVSLSPSPIQFNKNGITVSVTEDTVTPANNKPLPVKLMDVTGDINITAGDLNVQLSHAGASYDSTRIGDGTNLMSISAAGAAKVDGSAVTQPVSGTFWQATQPVSAASLPLPTGAATETKQDTGNTSLNSIDTKLPSNLTVTSTRLLVDGSGVTQPVSAASLPLPTGAATESTLTSLNNKINSLGQKTMALSTPVVLSSDQSALSVNATQTGAWDVTNISGTVSLPTGAATESTLSAMSAKLPTSLGIKTAANSLSVVMASDATVKIATQTGSFDEITSLTTAQTFTAPAGAFGATIQADDANTTNLRFKSGDTATASSGIQLQPGRSEPIESGSNISVCAESGTCKVQVQWFVRA